MSTSVLVEGNSISGTVAPHQNDSYHTQEEDGEAFKRIEYGQTTLGMQLQTTSFKSLPKDCFGSTEALEGVWTLKLEFIDQLISQ